MASKLGLSGVTFPAQWHIQIGAPNHLLALHRCRPEREARRVLTQFANRRQLLDLLAQRHQISDIGPGPPMKGPLQC